VHNRRRKGKGWGVGVGEEDENSTCHPTTTKRGFVKGEGLRLLRTNSSKAVFEEEILTTLKNV